MKTFIDFCKHQHDIECNQKYDGNLPYSFHLNLAAKQVDIFKYLLSKRDQDIAICGIWGHDLIEDARITYNDIRQMKIYHRSPHDTDGLISEEVANVIYACTELRGKNRSERHGPEFIQGLRECRLGLFDKLCDISANIIYGLATNSRMYDKYKSEFPYLKEELYTEEFKPIWDYIEKLLNLR